MLYSLVRPLLFSMQPEKAHGVTFKLLDSAHRIGLLKHLGQHHPCAPRTVMGLTFPNPVGLAAGLDKNGEHIDALADLGFGFIEIGTVTPRPQPGNPMPRMFRLPGAQAIINRMGFNNDGVDALVANVQNSDYQGILGVNIGKNFDTPIENAVDDYLIGLRKVYAHANYITVNISSPNTKNLRQLQGADELTRLVMPLKEEQKRLADRHGYYVPIALKIAPDLESAQLEAIADVLVKAQIDAVIATNTTLSRTGVESLPFGDEAGGLSGTPVRVKSTSIIRDLSRLLHGQLPIIGVGGIMKGDDASEKMRAGASLVQIYSGLIYRGPELIGEAQRAIG